MRNIKSLSEADILLFISIYLHNFTNKSYCTANHEIVSQKKRCMECFKKTINEKKLYPESIFM